MITGWVLVSNTWVMLNEIHKPRCEEFLIIQFNGRWGQSPQKEIMTIKALGVCGVVNQLVHNSFDLSFGMTTFNGANSVAHDVIDCPRSVLQVFHEAFLWKYNIRGQWLHKAHHLRHIRFCFVEPNWCIFFWKSQAYVSKQFRSRGSEVSITCHVVEHPCWAISIETRYVHYGKELQDHLFIPMFFVIDEWRKTNRVKCFKSFIKTWHPFQCFKRNVAMNKYPVLIEENIRIILTLRVIPEAIKFDARRIRWIVL